MLKMMSVRHHVYNIILLFIEMRKREIKSLLEHTLLENTIRFNANHISFEAASFLFKQQDAHKRKQPYNNIPNAGLTKNKKNAKLNKQKTASQKTYTYYILLLNIWFIAVIVRLDKMARSKNTGFTPKTKFQGNFILCNTQPAVLTWKLNLTIWKFLSCSQGSFYFLQNTSKC